MFNLSGMVRASSNIYLLTENYLFGVNIPRDAYLDSYNSSTETTIYRNEEYIQRMNLWYGVAGIRIINKNKDFVAWQIGLTYVLTFPGSVPQEYANWETGTNDMDAFAFPALSYTRKFGRRY